MSSYQIAPVKKDGIWVHYSVGGTNFIVDQKYELLKLIGIGAYGLVWYEKFLNNYGKD